VPSDKHDIRLGDVVVSMPEGAHGGVVQYDLGKHTEDGFQLKGFLWPPPPTIVRSVVGMMGPDLLTTENKVNQFLSQMLAESQRLSTYARPSVDLDILFEPDYPHASGESTCAKCDRSKTVARKPRPSTLPEIHYGLIASGDRVVKSAAKRDLARQVVGDILCFEVEAAGIATEFSCITIRGISDYADSHKNGAWQCYAAAAAAACAKALLSYLDPEKLSTDSTPPHRSGPHATFPCSIKTLHYLEDGDIECVYIQLPLKGQPANVFFSASSSCTALPVIATRRGPPKTRPSRGRRRSFRPNSRPPVYSPSDTIHM